MAIYKKQVKLKYKHNKSDNGELLLNEVFDSIFEWLISEQKQLRRYFLSEEYKRLVKSLKRRKSILLDYVSTH